ncbi:hypothetical protein AVEN_123650-1 [Araneus ventricosus]|uniref:Uncharacterized protein n=1 Tax=Araneus ventricosus TaxID=182803 RepID=A0A4Y2R7P2_ARAVE|nr:hypothetical protein AVEN_123650-1 [Araneus ventricosus]
MRVSAVCPESKYCHGRSNTGSIDSDTWMGVKIELLFPLKRGSRYFLFVLGDDFRRKDFWFSFCFFWWCRRVCADSSPGGLEILCQNWISFVNNDMKPFDFKYGRKQETDDEKDDNMILIEESDEEDFGSFQQETEAEKEEEVLKNPP